MKRIVICAWFIGWVAISEKADAILIMSLSDSNGAVAIVIDNAAIGVTSAAGAFTSTIADADSQTGVIRFVGTVGSYEVDLNGFSKPRNGIYALDFNAGSPFQGPHIRGGGDGSTLTMILIDTDFAAVLGLQNYDLRYSGLAGTDGVIDFFLGSLDNSNSEANFSSLISLGSFGPGVSLPASPQFTGNAKVLVESVVGNFSMAIGIQVTHSSAVQGTSFNSDLNAYACGGSPRPPDNTLCGAGDMTVPEPSSLALAALGVVAIGIVRRIRSH